MQACSLTKQNFLLYFDARLEHMATWPRGNGSYVDWLMKSCDTSPCALSPEIIPEKYGRPVKSAIPYWNRVPNRALCQTGLTK